jgi:hypothetical protein
VLDELDELDELDMVVVVIGYPFFLEQDAKA